MTRGETIFAAWLLVTLIATVGWVIERRLNRIIELLERDRRS